MVWAGARRDTETELAAALRFPLPQAQLHPAFDALDLELEAPVTFCDQTPNPFKLRFANAAWVQKSYPFVPAFLDTLAASYGAGVSLLDFVRDPDAARQTINDAVARATEDRIRDLLPKGALDDTTKFVLTNAVYFRGNWEVPFNAAQTAPGSFRLLAGGAADVPFMHGRLLARAAVQPAYDAVELRYACSRFAMTLVAPKAGTFDAFEGALDAAGLEAVNAALADAWVTLSMPKFGFRWGSKSLKDALQALGVTSAFDTARADFTGIADLPGAPLYLSDVQQQTFISVDEEGTEAAAATFVSGAGGGLPPKPPEITVSVDRPFVFFIRHVDTGQILFLGRVVDPR
jgi:serpin B